MESITNIPQEDPSRENISKKGMQWFFGIQLVVLIVAAICLLDVGNYGWTLFCVIPFSLGITAGVYTKTYKTKKVAKGIGLVVLIVCAISGFLMVVGVEGAICVLMASGLIVLPMMIGMLAGYAIRNAHKIYGLGLILLLNSSAYVYDKNDLSKIESIASESIRINASREKVWDVLVHPVEYSFHENLFFKAGVTYPQGMSLSEKGGKCFLSCRLNNGNTDLPVVKIDTLKSLRFAMPRHFTPMKELSPYDSIHAAHLEGYFLPSYGEFSITPIGSGQCLLKATTVYSYKITPVFYWRWWSDYLVNAMHRHVLTDIKTISEQSN